MNRIVLGALCGVLFGVIDVLMVIFGKHPDRTIGMLLQAFFSRFAIGLLGERVAPSASRPCRSDCGMGGESLGNVSLRHFPVTR